MKRIINLIIILIALTGLQVQAGGVDFKVSVPNQVSLGERFRLTYQINADVDDFTHPTFDGLRILSGPSRSQNSSIQIVNGKVSQNISISYSYVMVANREGEITIPAATVKVSGKTYKSATRTLLVGSANKQAATTSNGNSNSQTQQSGGLKASDVYIKAFASKSDVYLGEKIIVTYRIYTKVPVSNLSVDKLSSFAGFWSIDLLGDQQKLNQRQEVINGEQYIVADLKKAALYPQKTGDLIIEPMSLSCIVQVQSSRKKTTSNDPFFDSFFNDPFFSNSYRNIEKQLKSAKLKIHVKDLPAAGKPIDFSGAVGSFSLGSNIDHNEIMANEAVTLKYTISGKGNIDLLPDLNLDFPPDFEVYDPKVTTKTRKQSNGVSGYKTFEYTVIPRSAGDYEIPPVSFSFFDPAAKQYKELKSDAYQIKVNRSNKPNQNISYGGNTKEDIRYIGKDIRHIYMMPFQLEPVGHFFFGSNLFYLLLILPLLLSLIIVFVWRKERKKRGNISLMKNKNATKVARKRLKEANVFLKSREEASFYNELGQALWGYVSDKFSIPLAELSIDSVHDKLKDKGVNEEVIKEFVDTLNDCEFARFAPGDKASTMEKVYQQGIDIISKIEDQLK
ncbi:MAG: protein BatD [Bacteroidetes bacterium]|nr:MAG: protein BatD [Bacteroidota bacterium]